MNEYSPLQPTFAHITECSRNARVVYQRRMDQAHAVAPARRRLSCGNLTHGFAAAAKPALRAGHGDNIAIVTVRSDMLSMHQPLEQRQDACRLFATDHEPECAA